MMTLRRLRDAGLPLSLVIIFFIPLINLIFFVLLAAIPGTSAPIRSSRGVSLIGRVIPESELGSAAFGVLATAFLTALEIAFTTNGLGNYFFFKQKTAYDF